MRKFIVRGFRNLQNTRLALAALLLVFSLSLSGAAIASGPATFDEALALATKENKVLVVDFFTDW